jgi:hypothetical protein
MDRKSMAQSKRKSRHTITVFNRPSLQPMCRNQSSIMAIVRALGGTIREEDSAS